MQQPKQALFINIASASYKVAWYRLYALNHIKCLYCLGLRVVYSTIKNKRNILKTAQELCTMYKKHYRNCDNNIMRCARTQHSEGASSHSLMPRFSGSNWTTQRVGLWLDEIRGSSFWANVVKNQSSFSPVGQVAKTETELFRVRAFFWHRLQKAVRTTPPAPTTTAAEVWHWTLIQYRHLAHLFQFIILYRHISTI